MPSVKDEQSKYQIDMINEMDIKYQKAMERKEGFELGEIKGREEGFRDGKERDAKRVGKKRRLKLQQILRNSVLQRK